jgi:hypothetical protein
MEEFRKIALDVAEFAHHRATDARGSGKFPDHSRTMGLPHWEQFTWKQGIPRS